MPKEIEMINRKFGKLTEISFAGNKNGERAWICLCDCGNITKAIRGSDLRNGSTKSCGCLKKENSTRRTHGLGKSKLYDVWKTMRRRCNSPTSHRYEHYGRRGIKVCDEWNDYAAFHKWAYENGYHEGLTIDRVDVNGDYKPDNCRWTTMKVQSNNKRNSKIVEINGETKSLTEWADFSNKSYWTLRSRYDKGVRGEELLK